jgi:hypothetical protein
MRLREGEQGILMPRPTAIRQTSVPSQDSPESRRNTWSVDGTGVLAVSAVSPARAIRPRAVVYIIYLIGGLPESRWPRKIAQIAQPSLRFDFRGAGRHSPCL